MPRVRRAKKQRVFRNVVAAANPDEAIDKVRGDRKMLHACSWHAEEIEGPFAAIDWTLE
jgi:hypothetical protein